MYLPVAFAAAVLLASAASAAETLFVFSAPWCPVCKAAKADLDADPRLAGGREIVTIDVEQQPGVAKKLGVGRLPTFIVAEDGHEARRLVGYPGKARFARWASR